MDYGDDPLVHREDGRTLVCYLRFLYDFRHLIKASLGVCAQINTVDIDLCCKIPEALPPTAPYSHILAS